MLAAFAVSAALASSTAACESLKSLSLPNTTFVTVEMVPASAPGGATAGAPAGGRGGRGGGTPAAGAAPAGRGGPSGGPAGPPAAGRGGGGGGQIVPAHCRIDAILRPSSDSEIEMEAWLPDEWNGKFQFVGGGGWAGTISTPAMVSAVQEGYATASTDTGHKGGNALFAIDHPQKLIDFAYRAVHETTVQTKALIEKYYARAPQWSYWNGCSTGGRQGLMEAQKYPNDFDAILAGAPANYQTHLHAWDLSVAVPVVNDPAAAVPPAKLAMLNRAVLDACDAKDGVKDGLISNPRACTFDPGALLCKGADSDSCLTAPQLASAKRAYGTTMTKAGVAVFPGKEFGSETGWGAFIAATTAPAISVGSFQVAYNDANWDSKAFDLDRDLNVVDEKVGTIINAIDPDLSAFKARGGKLILYHGWEDTAISPGNTVNYYESVLKKMGGDQANFVRLFMVPGMQHCGGGDGPNPVNYMAALERWREENVAPESLLAARVVNNRVDMTRPICPYPQVATYTGKGSTNDAANFACKAPAK